MFVAFSDGPDIPVEIIFAPGFGVFTSMSFSCQSKHLLPSSEAPANLTLASCNYGGDKLTLRAEQNDLPQMHIRLGEKSASILPSRNRYGPHNA